METTIVVNGITYTRESTDELPYVIVRCRDAGVHAGYLVSQEGRTVELRNSRRCWKFTSGGLGSCSELETDGLTGESMIAPSVGRVWLLDACEVLVASTAAQTSITGAKNG